MAKGFTIVEFRERFQTEADYLNYLIELKWRNGYACFKCQCNEFHKGRKWYYRRCKSCVYGESATANTLFHKCKLGLMVAFEMAYKLSVKKKGISTM
jgi:predicted nucleic-acid-binding Zn-ribbon protein